MPVVSTLCDSVAEETADNTVYVVQPDYPLEEDSTPPGVRHTDEDRDGADTPIIPSSSMTEEPGSNISSIKFPITNTLSGQTIIYPS